MTFNTNETHGHCEEEQPQWPRHEKKNNKMSVGPAKTQISLGIRPV